MQNTNDHTLQANSPQREKENTDTQEFGAPENSNEIGDDRFDTATPEQNHYDSARAEDDEDEDRDTDDDDNDDDNFRNQRSRRGGSASPL